MHTPKGVDCDTEPDCSKSNVYAHPIFVLPVKGRFHIQQSESMCGTAPYGMAQLLRCVAQHGTAHYRVGPSDVCIYIYI